MASGRRQTKPLSKDILNYCERFAPSSWRALVLGVGIYLCTSAELGRFSDVIAAMETLKSIRVILIGCGCVILLVGLFGCSGSCKESSCLLTVYAFLLAILLIANITVAIFVLHVQQRGEIFRQRSDVRLLDRLIDRERHFHSRHDRHRDCCHPAAALCASSAQSCCCVKSGAAQMAGSMSSDFE
uniref:Tetraspanin n=1 Tax=Macrostomum lignano TaxID=282301 RepID=A0A1I8FJ37_9PLAT